MNNKLYGAILGDLAGQPYEYKYKGDYSEFNIHNSESHITDDTLMTLATAKALMEDNDFERCYKEIGLKYESNYFGNRFREWLRTPMRTKSDSFGNGCLMRISPIMYLMDNDSALVKRLIIKSCITSHCHEDSILSSLRLYHLYFYGDLLQEKNNKAFVPFKFEKFQVEAPPTVDFCVQVINKSTDIKETIKLVVSAGGDTDTNASIVGEAINYIHGGIDTIDKEYVESKLDNYLLNILRKFNKQYDI